MAEAIKDIIREAQRARDRQGDWRHHWDELARVMSPRRLGFVTQTEAGDSRVDEIFDGTPLMGARGLANALGGLLHPDGEKWHLLRASDDELNEDEEARRWLEDANDRVRQALENPRARFRQASGEAELDLVVLGTALVFVTEGRNLDHLLFKTFSLQNAAIEWDDDGKPIRVYVWKKMDLRSAEKEFGLQNLSEDTQKAIRDKKLDEKIEILHVVLPRRDRALQGLRAQNMPIASLRIEVEAEHLVKESGFREMPFVAPRMDTMSGEEYGRSPGMIALPDANTLNAMGETILIAGQRAADPPLFAPNDGSFTEANTFPGGLSYYDVDTAKDLRGNPVFPLSTGMDLPLTREMQQDVRGQVMSAFFRNVFNLPPAVGTPMTATEVIARREEFIREVGPIFGRLETDYIAPIVDRSFRIMLRAGAFLPIPESLQGQDVRFEYESPIKRTRQQVEAAAAQAWALELMNLAQAKPEVLDNLDSDEYAKFQAMATGVPLRVVVSSDTVQQIRQARAQAQQAMEQDEALQRAADIGHTVASAADKAGMTNAEPAPG